VPLTVGVHAEVWLVWIEEGVQVTVTPVIVDDEMTATVAEPDLEVFCVDVAVMVAVPVVVGVKTPLLLTVPILVGLTAQLTAEL